MTLRDFTDDCSHFINSVRWINDCVSFHTVAHHFHPSVCAAHTVLSMAPLLQLLFSLVSGHSPFLDEEVQDLDESATFKKVGNANCWCKSLELNKEEAFNNIYWGVTSFCLCRGFSLPVETEFKDCWFLWVLTVLILSSGSTHFLTIYFLKSFLKKALL